VLPRSLIEFWKNEYPRVADRRTVPPGYNIIAMPSSTAATTKAHRVSLKTVDVPILGL
jgi:hypothetical protein